MSAIHGFGLGVATQNTADETLDVFYPAPLSNIDGDLATLIKDVCGPLDDDQLAELCRGFTAIGADEQARLADQLRSSAGQVVATTLLDNAAPATVADAYL